MSWVTSNLKQDVTYWSLVGLDENGDPTFSSPITIKARWEDTNEVNLSASGQTFISQAVVYLSQDVGLGDYLYLGVSVEANPINQKGSKIVMKYNKIPSLNGKHFERRAVL